MLTGLTCGCSMTMECPECPVGVHIDDNAYVSVAKVEALMDTDESRSFALEKARMLAKSQLSRHVGDLGLDNKVLSGAVDLESCHLGNVVYAAVRVTRESVLQSRSLLQDMERSIAEYPTPQP